TLESQRASRGRHVRGVDVVLQPDRNSVQRTPKPSLRTLAVTLLSLAQGVWIDRHHRVQLLVVERDPRQILLDELARGDVPVRHRPPHVRDAGLDDVEFAARRAAQQRKKQNDWKRLHHRLGWRVWSTGWVTPSRPDSINMVSNTFCGPR